MRASKQPVSEGTYAELVASLFVTCVPTFIMSGLFAGAGFVIVTGTGDRMLTAIWAAGLLASMIRIFNLLEGAKRMLPHAPPTASIRRIERRFATSYLMFAAILGAFGARTFQLPAAQFHALVAVLLVGYAAGVATATALRPWIGVPSILLAVLPTALVLGLRGDLTALTLAATLVLLVIGGIRSMLVRYRVDSASITNRHAFSALARRDHLTGLPNRLALLEHFAALTRRKSVAQSALHCIDLDRFKPVNDRFGHPVGDAVLAAVADRLRQMLRGDDLAARAGGDEFIFIQTGIRHADEAPAMARQIEHRLNAPYEIGGNTIEVGASVGYAAGIDHGGDFDKVVNAADEAQRARKVARSTSGAGPAGSAESRLRLVR